MNCFNSICEMKLLNGSLFTCNELGANDGLGTVYMDSGNMVTLPLALPWPKYFHDNFI